MAYSEGLYCFKVFLRQLGPRPVAADTIRVCLVVGAGDSLGGSIEQLDIEGIVMIFSYLCFLCLAGAVAKRFACEGFVTVVCRRNVEKLLGAAGLGGGLFCSSDPLMRSPERKKLCQDMFSRNSARQKLCRLTLTAHSDSTELRRWFPRFDPLVEFAILLQFVHDEIVSVSVGEVHVDHPGTPSRTIANHCCMSICCCVVFV